MNKITPLILISLLTSSVTLLVYLINSGNHQQNYLNILMLIIATTIILISIISHKKYQHLQQEINKKFDFAQNAARIGIWDWDIKNKCIHFSDTALDILGFDPDKPILTNSEFFYLIYKPDRANHLKELKNAMQLALPYSVEIRCNLKNQHKRWIHSKGEIIFDKNNQPLKMLGMHQDITDVVIQRQLQKKMKLIMQNIIKHEKLGNILTKICSAVEEIESSVFCVIYLSYTDTERLKLYHSNSIPDTLKHILNSITIEDKNSELMQTLHQKNTLYIENLNQLPSWQSANQLSNTLNISAYCGQTILSGSQSTEGAICLYLRDSKIPMKVLKQILDISSRIAAVAIEGQHQTDSQQKIQQQLYHSQKMDSIGHLTGGIAHDFNNILGSIVGYNSLAKKIVDKQDHPKLLQFLNEVSIAAKRARDLIRQMMIFSRSEPSINIPVDIKPVIKEVLQLVKSMIPSSITITQDFKHKVSNISINPIALHQVVMNMLINAKDAADNNVGTISIRLYEEYLNSNKCDSCHEHYSGKFVCIEIKDTGSGIPSTLIGRIFEPFFTTKDIGQGTGMGLSVVHGIIHDSFGHISVTSTINVGTTFRLYLPALAEGEQAETIDASVTDKPVHFGNGEHIMVVDDDVPLTLLFEEILNSYGYKVSRFDSSQLALECFLSNPKDFDLILSDQTMPFLTGDEMSKKMLLVNPDLPIIVCTGYSEKIDDQKAKEIGINTLLKKPVDMYKLLDIINMILSK